MAKAYRQNEIDSHHVLSQAMLPRYLASHSQLNNRTAVIFANLDDSGGFLDVFTLTQFYISLTKFLNNLLR